MLVKTGQRSKKITRKIKNIMSWSLIYVIVFKRRGKIKEVRLERQDIDGSKRSWSEHVAKDDQLYKYIS